MWCARCKQCCPKWCTYILHKWKWWQQNKQHAANDRLKCVISVAFVCRVDKALFIVARSHADTAFYLFGRNTLGTLMHSKYEVFSREVCDLGHVWCVKQHKTLPGVPAVLVWLLCGQKILFEWKTTPSAPPPNKRLWDLTMEAIMMIMMMRVTMTTLARCAEHRA